MQVFNFKCIFLKTSKKKFCGEYKLIGLMYLFEIFRKVFLFNYRWDEPISWYFGFFFVWTDTRARGMPIFRFFIINLLVCTQMWQKWYIPRRIMPNTLCKTFKFIILEFSTWRTHSTQNVWFFFYFFLNSFIYCVPFHKSNYIQVVLRKLKKLYLLYYHPNYAIFSPILCLTKNNLAFHFYLDPGSYVWK